MNKSDQTKQGIARSRARGVVWGAYAAVLAQQNREQAGQFAVSLRLLRRLPGLKEELAEAREAKHQERRSTLQDNLAKKQAGNTGAS